MNNTTSSDRKKYDIIVLLIDDQQIIGEAVRRMLAAETDIDFHYCQSAEQAIPTAIDVSPTVILQDLIMPEIDGLTMVKYFRRDPATIHIPLIVLSSEEDAKTKADAFALGANDYLIKLPEREELIARIRYHSRSYINMIERNEAFATIIKKQTELLEAHNTLDAILSKVPIGIAILNFDGNISWINRPALAILKQKDANKIIGNNFRNYVVNPEEFLNDIQSDDVFNAERILLTADQQNVTIMESILKTSMHGNPVLIYSFIDVSRQKKAEQENRTIQLKMQQSQKMESVGKLAAGIAHEINTPLQFIRDNLQFIQQSLSGIDGVINQVSALTAVPPAMTEKLESCLNSLKTVMEDADIDFVKNETAAAVRQSIDGTGRIAEIVQAMKAFANNSGGKIASYDINEMIENTVTISANQWRAVADLKQQLEPGGLNVMCCSEEINQVLLNLIVNAAQAIEELRVVKNTSAPGTIRITSRRHDESAVIEISDSGIGIPDEAKNRIFEPFFTTREVGKGMGQGLTIAYDLVVNKHHGELSFITAQGQGTTFIVKLPLRQKSQL